MGNMKRLLTFIFFFLVCSSTTLAASTSLSGNTSLGEGKSGSASLVVNGQGSLIGVVGGTFTSNNSSCISITSVSSSHSYTIVNGNKIAYLDLSGAGFSSTRTIAKVNYKAVGTNCSAVITYVNDQVGTIDSIGVSANNSSVTVKSLSNDNNLTSLTTSVGSVNFSANTTSYSLNVDSSVSSININATAVNGASVSGIGSKSLNYGNNTFYINVTSASGIKKTYTITVNRKDDRSTNNNLSSLTINDGTLTPDFSSSNTSYKIIVPFEVEDLNIKAVASDSKSKVTISNNTGLISEETKDVYVKVTAENGSVKTYTISTTRGKDPNKPLSDISYLSSLSSDYGTLSPKFDKEIKEYLIWVPYEVSDLNLEFSLEDSKWGLSNYNKPDTLEVGKNEYNITVTAEDLSITEYKISVMRGYSVGTEEIRDSLLKEININNGSLTKTFNSDIFTYIYKGDIEVSAIANYEDSTINIYLNDGIFTIYVEDINGNTSVYILKPYVMDTWFVIIPSLFIFPIIYIVYKVVKNKVNKKEVTKKKVKKNDK